MAPPLKKHKTVRQALQFVELKPQWPSDLFDDRMEMPVWEMVARNLFDHANPTDVSNRSVMARGTRAQKIILDRLTGRRRMGTHPAVRNAQQIQFNDLTGGAVEGAKR